MYLKAASFFVSFLFMELVLCFPNDKRENFSFEKFVIDYANLNENSWGAFYIIVCWKYTRLVDLVKNFSGKGFQINPMLDCNLENIHITNHRTVFVLDITCPFTMKCLEKANQMKLFRAPYRWLLLEDIRTPISLYSKPISIIKDPCEINNRWYTCPENYFNFTSMLIDSNLLVATATTDDKLLLSQFYKYRPHTSVIQEIFGYWHPNIGIMDHKLNPVLALRRKNIESTKLTASMVIINNDSLNHLLDYKDKHIDSLTKVNYPLTLHLTDFLNATSKFTVANTWGYQNSNGTWNGIIGQCLSGEADIAATVMFMTKVRMPVVEYISITTRTTVRFVFRQPQLSYVSNIYLLPFEKKTWLALMFMIFVTCCVLYATVKFESIRASKEAEQKVKVRNWSDVWMMAIGAVSQQGSSDELHLLSGRITMIVTFISLMFLFTSYSANIVALIQSQSNSIKTLEDLLNSKLKLGADDNLYNRHYFPRSTEPVKKAIWSKKIAPKGEEAHFYSLEKGIKLMQKTPFAFHMELGIGYKIMQDIFQEHEKCGIGEIKFLDMYYPWFVVQKNSSFLEIFKIGMHRIGEHGLSWRQTNRVYTKKPTCSSNGNFISVGIVEVRPALVLLASGILIALSIFVLEKIFTIKMAARHAFPQN